MSTEFAVTNEVDLRKVEQAASLIDQADALIVAAGAGMGVDSGLPDFRGATGFWQAYPTLGHSKISFSSIASPKALRETPDLAWGFYGHRLALYRRTVPHMGFSILNEWGTRMPYGLRVFTSNVDGQFQKAGFDPDSIYECHGSLHYFQCLEPCSDEVWSAEGFEPDVDEDRCILRNAFPRCPNCGRLARPNVMMFNDHDWLEERAMEKAARLEVWLSRVSRPVIVELGAGTAIPTVRHFSHRIIHEFGGRLIRINPREPAVPSSLDVGFAGSSAAVLAAINRLLGQSSSY